MEIISTFDRGRANDLAPLGFDLILVLKDAFPFLKTPTFDGGFNWERLDGSDVGNHWYLPPAGTLGFFAFAFPLAPFFFLLLPSDDTVSVSLGSLACPIARLTRFRSRLSARPGNIVIPGGDSLETKAHERLDLRQSESLRLVSSRIYEV
ncbi:hypothetical protein MSAN_01441000 [Mycena sanguinolenta]|uniref:Uncharacterized protein n=1 Tax=Mycena sanguinolenta TaxID=230812 RepID=A0A8H6YBX4_9AGAR|nr:hypothetical protein MSAN_01441000 [Mycena sanguinolenta]